MQTSIIINPEYESIVPIVSDVNYQKLKESIKNKGLHLPLILNQNNVILDGHHRFKVCQELGIEPIFEVKRFDDPLDEKEFVIDINVKRRQLNDFQLGLMAMEYEKIESARARNRQIQLAGTRPNHTLCPNGHKVETGKARDIAAKKVGISKTTYERIKTIVKDGTKEQNAILILGNTSTTINKEYNKIKKQNKKKDLQTIAIETKLPQNCNIYNEDFITSKNIPDNSIDLIFTDPPYAVDSLFLYEQLGTFAKRVLKDGGCLVTFAGQLALNRVYRILDDSGLTYWWTLTVKHNGPRQRIHPRSVFSEHKPLLWYVKGNKPINLIDTIGDHIESQPPAKELHEWAQSTTEADYVIRYLTVENQKVLDPMMGSGTTGIATLKLNRNFTGIEKDQERFEVAKRRLSLHDNV